MKLLIYPIALSLLGGIFCSSTLTATTIDEPTPNETNLQVVQMNPTPEPEEVELRIVYPASGEMKTSWPIRFEARLDGYVVGTASQFERASQIQDDPNGQSIHVIIDDRDYFEAYEELFDSLDNHDLYFDEKIDFTPPFKLEPGKHIVRMFPTRSYGESLKGHGCFDAQVFYYKTKDTSLEVDLKKPFLTYNEPQGTYPAKKPILLDFYIRNCIMSNDGYKVKLTIDGEVKRILTSWKPYYIYGLSKGAHTIQLELLDRKNQLVPGSFNTVSKTIQVQ
ncbi:MAG: hypothetical protein EBZ47_05735 [Chlamydiae bacterium]|nr:hypothetical protein [Chlamydiota bacterium]